MANWHLTTLDQLGSVQRGKSRHRPRNASFLYGGPYPFIQTAEITAADLYITKFTQTYSEDGLAQSKMWNEGTLCIVNAGENTGECAILKFKACFPDSVIAFVADPQKSDVKFVKYFFDTQKNQIKQVTKGATQDNLSISTLLSFKFPAPPLDVQQKIASILSAYDDLIENNTRRIQILEEMARMIYREWFVQMQFPGHAPREDGKLPEGWRIGIFTDFINIGSGGTPRTNVPGYWDGDIDWFSPPDIQKSFYVFDTKRKITELGLAKCNSDLYPAETVFITARGTVGKCVIAAKPMAMSQTSYALNGKDGLSQHFIYLLTLSLVDALKKQATGAVFDTIVIENFRKQKVIIPADDTLLKFTQVIDPIFALIKDLQQKNSNLRRTRELLLPKLVSGEIDVSKVDIPTSES